MAHRPFHHFTAPKNWLNDPNGLIHWRGQYHLFYQWNPDAPRWGNIHWGHAVSDDLLSWRHLPAALAPTNDFDLSGCWSGCAVADGDELKLVYTAARNYDPARDSADVQIRLASSRDGVNFQKGPALLEWPWGGEIGGHQLSGFRDPVVWREGSEWKMTVGAGLEGRGGAAKLYASTDLLDWRYLGLLASADQARDPLWTGSVWECAQLVGLGEAHALLLSVWHQRRGEYAAYLAGRYDGERLEPRLAEKLDHGDSFYAPQAARDAEGEWFMLGWLRETRSPEAQAAAGWSGLMSLPRRLGWREGRLWQEPHPNLAQLRSSETRLDRPEVGAHPLVSLGGAFELELDVRKPGWTLVLAEGEGRAMAALEQTPTSLELRRDGETFALPLDQSATSVRLFWDGSALEVFAGGRVLSVRLYLETAPAATLKIQDRGAIFGLRAHALEKVQSA